MAEAKWYVVHTYSGYENKVKTNIEKAIETQHLEEQILDVRVPMVEVTETKDGVKKQVSKKMYPGYVLIEMIMNDETWYVVRNTRGVTGFVGPGSKPVPLSEADVAYLEDTASLMVTYPTIPCNSCQYCMPCPYGWDIPGILVHYNKCVNEGNVPESRQDPNYKKARQAFLVGYDRSVPKLRQASHCTGCNQCSPECPQRINIPQQMQRIDKYVEALKQETL